MRSLTSGDWSLTRWRFVGAKRVGIADWQGCSLTGKSSVFTDLSEALRQVRAHCQSWVICIRVASCWFVDLLVELAEVGWNCEMQSHRDKLVTEKEKMAFVVLSLSTPILKSSKYLSQTINFSLAPFFHCGVTGNIDPKFKDWFKYVFPSGQS